MKKTVLSCALLLTIIPMGALASDSFTGWSVGGELNSVKYTMSGDMQGSGKQGTGIAVFGGYGFDFGNDFVGIAEAKLKFGNAKITDEDGEVIKEKAQISIAYLQGYRITPQILPYIKVGVSGSYLNHSNDGYDNNGIRGFDYGAGVKYAVDNHLNVGFDFTRHNLSGEDLKFRGSQFGINVSYQF